MFKDLMQRVSRMSQQEGGKTNLSLNVERQCDQQAGGNLWLLRLFRAFLRNRRSRLDKLSFRCGRTGIAFRVC